MLTKDAGLKNTEITKLLNGLHSSGIGKIRDKAEEESGKNRKLQNEISEIRMAYSKVAEVG